MIQRGLTCRSELLVTAADTAIALGSGDLPVLATPRLLAMFEAATVAALSGQLSPGETSVGTRVFVEHRLATPVGDTLHVTAVLAHIDGRLLRFEVVARNGAGRVIGSGQVTRVVVDRERFLTRAQSTSA